jgi:hypothetical protein
MKRITIELNEEDKVTPVLANIPSGVPVKFETIYYKIVQADTLESYCKNNDFKIKYKVNEWVAPVLAGSKIFIFDTLADAQRFLYADAGDAKYSVYSCEALNVEPAKNMTRVYFNLVDFWNNNGEDCLVIDSPPLGTLYADKIKLLEKVHDYYGW